MHPLGRVSQKVIDEDPFANLKIDDITVLDTIEERMPQLEGKIPKLSLPIKIDIIKHKNEIDGKSTSAHAALLAPDDVRIFTYPAVPEYDSDENVVLVYPTAHAKTVKEYFVENSELLQMNEFPFTRAVFIDSTWNQSKGIYNDERIHSLPSVILKNKISQFWRHQKNSPRWYLATIEAIHELLVEMEFEKVSLSKSNQASTNIQKQATGEAFCYDGKYDNLLFLFYFMYTKIHGLYDHDSLLSYKRPLE